MDKKDKEIERLNNIINCLESWLLEKSKFNFNNSPTILHEQLALFYAYLYLKDLKGENIYD